METTITHRDGNDHHDEKQQGEVVSTEATSMRPSKSGEGSSAEPQPRAPKSGAKRTISKERESGPSKNSRSSQGKSTASVAEGTPQGGHREESPQVSTSGLRSSEPKNGQNINIKVEIPPRAPVEVSLRALLEAGVHYGHQTSRWNPAMAPFIHSVRNGIHIINLPKTIQCWQQAQRAIVDIVSSGGSVLFVGTKKQAQDAIVEEAIRSGSFFVSRRWLGGMLTNFQTIRKSIERMKKVEALIAEEELAIKNSVAHKFTKKERLLMSRELEKLKFSLGGIQEMHAHPQLLFVVDIKCEEIAVKEASRLDIPVVALIDTNCDPHRVTYPIPSNDDGTRAIRLFCQAAADAISEGRKLLAQKDGVSRGSARKETGETGRNDESREQGTPAIVADTANEGLVNK